MSSYLTVDLDIILIFNVYNVSCQTIRFLLLRKQNLHFLMTEGRLQEDQITPPKCTLSKIQVNPFLSHRGK